MSLSTPRWGLTRATVAQPTAWAEGFTLRKHPARVMFLPPMVAGTPGLQVQMVYGPDERPAGPPIQVGLSSLRVGQYALPIGTLQMGWSELVNAQVGVGVCEHMLGACVATGLTDGIIKVHYPGLRTVHPDRVRVPFVPNLRPWHRPRVASMPLFDGSAVPYTEIIRAAGMRILGEAQPLRLRERWDNHTLDNKSWISLRPRSVPGWSLTVNHDNPSLEKAPWWEGQQTEFVLDTAMPDFDAKVRLVEKARPTNSGMGKFRLYKYASYGTAQDGSFVVAYTEKGQWLPDQEPLAKDEAIRHRTLDLLGDFLAVMGDINADILIHYGSHAAMDEFRSQIAEDWVFYNLEQQ